MFLLDARLRKPHACAAGIFLYPDLSDRVDFVDGVYFFATIYAPDNFPLFPGFGSANLIGYRVQVRACQPDDLIQGQGVTGLQGRGVSVGDGHLPPRHVLVIMPLTVLYS
jgi:hypothetical protein